MVTNCTKVGSSTVPPHELNVWKVAESRALELESLHSVIAQRLDNNFRSQRNKRRRTTGHDNRVTKNKSRKRRRVGLADKVDMEGTNEKKISRRARRNVELKKNMPSGFGTSGDGTKRMRTHLWHAKRFTMTKLWGFHLPLGLHGRGRGSRALLNKLTHGVLAHDASYYGCVQLRGTQENLMTVLCSMLVPSPSSYSEEVLKEILVGANFGTAMIHNALEPCCPPIAPATYMWQPLQGTSINNECLSDDVFGEEQNIGDGSAIRQIWVWIHAAAFREAYDALSSACERLIDASCSAQCVSREGQLAKLELIGSKVFQLLQKTLLPVSSLENSWQLKKCSAHKYDDTGESKTVSIFESVDWISTSAVVPLVVEDPRGLTKEEKVTVSKERHKSLVCDIWDAEKEVCSPVEESVLCAEKHNQRKEFIRLGHKSDVPQCASLDGQYSRVCPILLLKNENREDSVTRCSIILPISWVKAFWITFVSNGAHAIGLREKHWVATATRLPYFPSDFPDCDAYSCFTKTEAKALPPSTRLHEVPIPPPWNCVYRTLEKRSSEVENSLGQVVNCSTQHEKIEETSNYDSQGIPFPGIIARMSSMVKVNGFLKQETAISELKSRRTRSFVSVLLRAYKEGVFEQGAVVCAPRVTDIMSWTTGSGSDEHNLQISQSVVESYFVQLSSGTWKLNVCEESLCGSYRWPIGFVTSGFVRGCKKAITRGICESSLLCSIRKEQWEAFPEMEKKEIYVLVRNMRSTAYRLALATVVLEQEEQDIHFL